MDRYDWLVIDLMIDEIYHLIYQLIDQIYHIIDDRSDLIYRSDDGSHLSSDLSIR